MQTNSLTEPSIALVRGINVGGRNMVKMSALTEFFAGLGLGPARTLLQSGNIVFRANDQMCEELEALLEREAKSRMNLQSHFFVRSLEEWDAAIAANPFSAEAIADPGHLLLTLLKRTPEPKEVEAVQAVIKGPERLEAVGRQLYTVYPDGVGNSTITRTPGWNNLAGGGTARNWNTVLKLAAIARAEP